VLRAQGWQQRGVFDTFAAIRESSVVQSEEPITVYMKNAPFNHPAAYARARFRS
jgi:hypothetical protein